MSAVDHDAMLDTAAAWVLDAVSDDEASFYAAHLEGCCACRDEVTRLQVVADVLPLAVPATEAPPELSERVMTVVRREAQLLAAAGPDADRAAPRRERRRLRLASFSLRPVAAVAGACVLLAAGAAAGVALKGDPGRATSLRALSVDASKAAGASGELARNGDTATLRVVNLPPPPKGRVYQVWVQRRGQTPQPDAVFTVDRHGTGSVALRGSLMGARRVLVTEEPDGGSSVPSRQPTLCGTLA